MSADLTYVVVGLALLLAVVLPDLLRSWPLSLDAIGRSSQADPAQAEWRPAQAVPR